MSSQSFIETQVAIADKMFRCRKSAKFMAGDDYDERVKVYVEMIQLKTKPDGNTIEAAMDLHAKIYNAFDPDYDAHEAGIALMWLLAACVEILLPLGDFTREDAQSLLKDK